MRIQSCTSWCHSLLDCLKYQMFVKSWTASITITRWICSSLRSWQIKFYRSSDSCKKAIKLSSRDKNRSVTGLQILQATSIWMTVWVTRIVFRTRWRRPLARGIMPHQIEKFFLRISTNKDPPNSRKMTLESAIKEANRIHLKTTTILSKVKIKSIISPWAAPQRSQNSKKLDILCLSWLRATQIKS